MRSSHQVTSTHLIVTSLPHETLIHVQSFPYYSWLQTYKLWEVSWNAGPSAGIPRSAASALCGDSDESTVRLQNETVGMA